MKLLAFLLVLFCGSAPALAQAGCKLIDPAKPAQVLSYELLETAKRPEVVLRFRNNTNCAVTVESYRANGALVLDKSAGEPPRVKLVGVEDYPDGKRIALKYLIEYQDPPPSKEKPLGVDEILYELRIAAGKSFTFTVPLFHFDWWVYVKVPFRYDWDQDFYHPAHHAVFNNLDLPQEILQKTKSCRLIDWCKASR